MLKQLFGNSGWVAKLFQLILICLLFLMIGVIAWSAIFGNTNSIDSQKILQLINSVFIFMLPVVFLSSFWYEKPVLALHLNKIPTAQQILLAILLIISVQPFINLLIYFNEQIQLPAALKELENTFKQLEADAKKITNDLLAVKTTSGYIINLFLMAVMPAVSEELFFRGATQNIFSEKFSKYTAIWITATLFSFIHFQMYGFFPRLILGALLGYLLVWSRTLWLPILAHFVNNAMAVTLGFLKPENSQIENIETIGKADTYVYGIISGIISVVILWLFYKNYKAKTPENT